MKIKNLRKISGQAKLRASFTVEFELKDGEIIEIHGCPIWEGERGLYAEFPKKEYMQKGQSKWEHIVFNPSGNLIKNLTEAVLALYQDK